MLKLIRYGLLLCSFAVITSCARQTMSISPPLVETGVSQTLARFRKQTLSDLIYAIKFDIPAQKNQPIPASETITFVWKPATSPLQLDFKEEPTHVQTVSANGTIIPIVFEQEHLLIDPSHLTPGPNRIDITFTAGNLSLNRNDDYLYTLLVPDRARTVFPCFDQPDLKAQFQLTITVPARWQGMTNAALQDSTVAGDRKTLRFGLSERIPTYLFSFVAGRFTPVRQTRRRAVDDAAAPRNRHHQTSAEPESTVQSSRRCAAVYGELYADTVPIREVRLCGHPRFSVRRYGARREPSTTARRRCS